jgi:CheY-like chemotaxis protein
MSDNNSKKGRVLVVDDEPLVRNAVRMVLMIDGYNVETAVDGHQALAKLDAEVFDLVILDFEMPEMKGDQLAKIVKQRFPCLPTIMLSAYGESLRSPERPLTGVDLLLDKPFSLEMLREGIAKTLAIYTDLSKAYVGV